jgi:hypothetical protein
MHTLENFVISTFFFMRVWNAILRSLWNARCADRRGFLHGLYILHPWLQTLKLTIIFHFNNGWHGLVEFQSPASAPNVRLAYNLPPRPCRIAGEKYLLTMQRERKQVEVHIAIHAVEVHNSEAIMISLDV